MKKFYTLLAAAAVTVGASAAQRATADYAQVAKDAKVAIAEKHLAIPATAQLKGVKAAASVDIVGTNFIQFYVIGSEGWDGPYTESFEIAAGEGANEYIVKGLLWGSDALDLKATYSTETYQGQTYEFLTIAGGQDWFENTTQTGGKQMCKLGIGFADPSTGDWGGNLTGDADFMLVDQNGQSVWIPAWSFDGQSENALSGLAWGYSTSATQWRGNVFPGSFVYPSNGTFTGDFTSDGETFEAESYDILAFVSDRFGKKSIQIYNVGGGEVMTLNVVNGVASATDQVYGYYYTDETHTATTPVYYWNNEESNEVMLVSGETGTENGKSVLNFGVLFVYWPGEGAGMGWDNAKINFDNDYGFVSAAINNVSADFDENAPVEYFNLQGVRVENPANGLYIKRQGNKVAKVIL